MEHTCTFYCDAEFSNKKKVREKIKIAILSAIYLRHTKFLVNGDGSEFDNLALSVLLEIQDHPMGSPFVIGAISEDQVDDTLHSSNLSIIYTPKTNTDLLSRPVKHLINLYSPTDNMDEQTLLLKTIYDDFSSNHE